MGKRKSRLEFSVQALKNEDLTLDCIGYPWPGVGILWVALGLEGAVFSYLLSAISSYGVLYWIAISSSFFVSASSIDTHRSIFRIVTLSENKNKSKLCKMAIQNHSNCFYRDCSG